eukprot:m.86102 g.86102  ORF g.86102 m.86102 type:complete len:98 (+) comp36489_c0_seq6:419-712(+)
MAQCSDAGQERPMDCPHFDFKERQQLFHHDPSDFTDAFIKLKLFCFYSENNSASCQHHYSRLQRFAKAFDYTKSANLPQDDSLLVISIASHRRSSSW